MPADSTVVSLIVLQAMRDLRRSDALQRKLLGHGACATCFLATDNTDGQDVALKVIRRSQIYPVRPDNLHASCAANVGLHRAGVSWQLESVCAPTVWMQSEECMAHGARRCRARLLH